MRNTPAAVPPSLCRIRMESIAAFCLLSMCIGQSLQAQSGRYDGDIFESQAVILIEPNRLPDLEITSVDLGLDDPVGDDHVWLMQNEKFIKACFQSNETLSKLPTFEELTLSESIELVLENLSVTKDPESPTQIALRFQARNATDSKLVMQSVISTYRKYLSDKWNDQQAENIDMFRNIGANYEAKRKDLLEQREMVHEAIPLDVARDESIRVLAEELHTGEAAPATKETLMAKVQECLQGNDDEEAHDLMRMMLVELGELTVVHTAQPIVTANKLLQVASLKISTEITLLEHRLASVRKQLETYSQEARKSERIERQLERLDQKLEAVDKVSKTVSATLAQLDIYEFGRLYDFEVLTPAAEGKQIEEDE